MLQRYGLIFLHPNIFATFFRKFFESIFAPRLFTPHHIHTYTHAHAHTYIKHYILCVLAPCSAPTTKGAKKDLFSSLQFLIKYFSKIICMYGRKVITLQPDTRSDGDTTETNAANSIHAHGNNRNEMRALLVI